MGVVLSLEAWEPPKNPAKSPGGETYLCTCALSSPFVEVVGRFGGSMMDPCRVLANDRAEEVN